MEINSIIRKTLIALLDRISKIGLKNIRNFKHMCAIMTKRSNPFSMIGFYKMPIYYDYLYDSIVKYILGENGVFYTGIRHREDLLWNYNVGLLPIKTSIKIARDKMSEICPKKSWIDQYYVIFYDNSPKVIRYICKQKIAFTYYDIQCENKIIKYMGSAGVIFRYSDKKIIYHYELILVPHNSITHNREAVCLNAFTVSIQGYFVIIEEAPKESILMRKLTLVILKKFTTKNLSKLIKYYL